MIPLLTQFHTLLSLLAIASLCHQLMRLVYLYSSLNLNPNKGSLTVPYKLASVAHEPLAMPFTALFNESVASGVVPELLKISSVTPIHKSGLMSDAGNYRPISTLSPFSKVSERLVYDQLLAFIEKENILYQYQFGFRKGFFHWLSHSWNYRLS